jgi:hypothetical protein
MTSLNAIMAATVSAERQRNAELARLARDARPVKRPALRRPRLRRAAEPQVAATTV